MNAPNPYDIYALALLTFLIWYGYTVTKSVFSNDDEREIESKILDPENNKDHEFLNSASITAWELTDQYWEEFHAGKREAGSFVDLLPMYHGKVSDFWDWLENFEGEKDVIVRIRKEGLVPYEERCLAFKKTWVPGLEFRYV